jgi:GntR family transcriptional repressor for pyruvate dehydrogenase complex
MLLLQEIKYLELYELRKILEPTVAALAARRATPEDLEKMEAAIRGMKASFNRPEQYMAAEMTFHEEFAQAAKNAAVETLLRMMYDALAEGRRRTLPLIDDFARNFERHQRIFRLIANRDAAGARRAVLEDLRYAETLLRKDLDAQKRFSDRMETTHPAPSTKRKAPAKALGARLKGR